MTAPGRTSLGERVFRALLRVFPGDFRGDFGSALTADVDAMRATARWWTREIPGLVMAIVREHADGVRQDAGYALRLMRRTPGFTLAAVLMLAVGTGVNLAMFSVIDAVMLRSDLPDADRVVRVYERAPDGAETNGIPSSHLDAIARAPMIGAVTPITGSLAVLRGVGVPHRLDIECVSSTFFDVVDTRPLIGRTFGPDEDRAGGPAVVVLGYQTWQRDFGGDPSVIGRAIDLNGTPNTVIGVMPRGFIGPYARNRIAGWAPFAPAAAHRSGVGCDVRGANLNLVARLRPPFTRESAAAAANAAGLIARMPMAKGQLGGQIQFTRADDLMFEGVRTPFLVLLGAVGCVLLIACANVANLQLERLVSRRRELAVRRALGASRGRVIRQTLTENLILSAAGAAVGVVAARAALSAVVRMMPATIPHVGEIQLDGRGLLVALTCALLVGAFCGLVPAWQATKQPADGHLRARGTTGGADWLRRGLVVTEVSLAVALLIGAGLLVRTFLVLRPDAPGFSTDGRVVAQLSLRGEWRADQSRLDTINTLVDRLGALPGVTSVSLSSYLPMSGMTDTARLQVAGGSQSMWMSWISANYLADMNIRIARGRGFSTSDGAQGVPVAIINESAARRFWPDSDPLGRAIAVTTSDGAVTTRQIVGVVGDTRSGGMDTKVRAELYVPFAQQPAPTLLYFILRTREPASGPLGDGVRSAVAAVIPSQIVDSIDPLRDRLDRTVSRPRFGAWLFGIFAIIAVALTVLGLGAVIAWWVAQRRKEIGVRMALGASRSQVTRLVIGQGLALTAVGIVIGIMAAAGATRLIAEWIYGITPLDPATFAIGGGAMLAIAAAAAYVPARQAARIDPAITLRAE